MISSMFDNISQYIDKTPVFRLNDPGDFNYNISSDTRIFRLEEWRWCLNQENHMNRFLISFVVLLTSFCFTGQVWCKELIREFKGSGNKTTAEFEVKAPWIVDWRTHGDYPGQMAVEVSLATVTGEYVGKIVTTKYVDDGVRLFNEGGRYVFKVNSSLASWTLRVEQLTEQEAETYKPKEKIE